MSQGTVVLRRRAVPTRCKHPQAGPARQSKIAGRSATREAVLRKRLPHPSKLAVAIRGDTTVGTLLHPSPPADSKAAVRKTFSSSEFVPLRWYAPDATV